MEYIAGVNSGMYPRPSYAYFRPKALEHSSISESTISIGFYDLQEGGWVPRLRAILESEFHPNVLASKFKKALYPLKEDYYYIKYCGYVCRNCLSIGVTIDERVAHSFDCGNHNCTADAIHAASHLETGERNAIFKSLNNTELPDLLYTIVTTFCNTGRFMLVTWEPHSKSPLMLTPMNIEDLPSFTKSTILPIAEIDKNELRRILVMAKSTYGNVPLEPITKTMLLNACIVIEVQRTFT